MKIEKLNYFEKALTEEFSQDDITIEVHYKHESNWFNLTKQLDPSDPLIKELETTKNKSTTHHPSKSITAHFFFEKIDTVVSLSFTKPPRSEKKTKCRSRIEKAKESSFNAYKVSHNPLTFLLAKDAFKERLTNSIQEFNSETPEDTEIQENKTPKLLAVLALDIDFFKQVNDTWGHLYGDQVLKIFAKRLDDTARHISEQPDNNVSIYVWTPIRRRVPDINRSF
ncbi:diguanylate cyclase domain-containing protein [Pseudomonas protegens]|uniref:diguanylate cyclase domain-containing protein n=1 Tax=Pseudomonas protegens TaxID=380021 RepID=UPI003809D685